MAQHYSKFWMISLSQISFYKILLIKKSYYSNSKQRFALNVEFPKQGIKNRKQMIYNFHRGSIKKK